MTCCKLCRNYEFWYILFCCIVYSLGYFYRNSISAITDALQEDLNTDASGIGLLSSFLYASYFGMQLIIGLLLEIYSFQLLLYLGSFGLGITGLLFGISTNVYFATCIRFLSGIALAPIFLTGISIGAQRYGNKHVSLITGILLFSSQSFFSAIVTFQAWLYGTHNIWREVYYVIGVISLFISFIVGIMSIFELKTILSELETTKNEHIKVDDQTPLMIPEKSLTGQSSFTQSLIFKTDWNLSKKSYTKTAKMLQSLKRSMKNISNWILGIQQFSLRSITYALNGLWIIAYLRLKYEYSPSLAAVISGVFFVSSSFGSVFSGEMMQKSDRRKIFLIIGVFLSQTCLIIIYVLPPKWESNLNDDITLLIVIMCNSISGFGCGFLPVGFTMARELNDVYKCSDTTRTATGMVNMIGNGAGFICQMIVSNLIDISWENNEREMDNGERIYTVQDYNFAFMLIPITGVIGLIMAIVVKEPQSIGSFISYSSFITSTYKGDIDISRSDIFDDIHQTEMDEFEDIIDACTPIHQ